LLLRSLPLDLCSPCCKRGQKMKSFIWTFRLLIAGAVLSVCWFASEHPSAAHAILIEAAPAVNATVAGPDVAIKLRFNSRMAPTRSRLPLAVPDGSTRQLEIHPQESPDRLSAQATGLRPGNYNLRWQVLASDGHITRGEIPFAVN